MNINSGFAIGFLGIFGAVLVINQASKLCRTFWPPISRWVVRHFVLPKLFHGQHIINPTRVELLRHVLHWVAAIGYNTWGVTGLFQAASRAGTIATIHIVPLSISYQLGFVSSAFGLSLSAGLKVHQSLAVMATVQGALRSIVQLQIAGGQTKSMVFQIMGISSLLALTILPPLRRYCGYEIFLYSHRAITISLFVGLWEHVRSRQTLGRILLEINLGGFLASTVFQNARQVYRNTTWDRHGVQLARTSQARQCGDSLVVKIRLPRPWRIRPGEYIYLSLLTLKCASVFQRHPFVNTWWEDVDDNGDNVDAKRENADDNKENEGDKSKAQVIYVMIDPQHGWTQRVMARQSVFTNQIAWLDGPFGTPYRFEEYGTVILFAFGNGIFAQLPLLKGLVDGLKCSAVKTRKVKLVWQTDVYHKQLQEWMHSILRDDEVDRELLDICIHQPASSTQLEGSNRLENYKIHKMNRWVRIIYDVPDVERYIQLELVEPRKSIAVTVSGHQQLRDDVRLGVIRAERYNIRLFEHSYQPRYVNRQKGGTAA